MPENVAMNVISAYDPQVGCEERVKETFLEDLDAVFMT